MCVCAWLAVFSVAAPSLNIIYIYIYIYIYVCVWVWVCVCVCVCIYLSEYIGASGMPRRFLVRRALVRSLRLQPVCRELRARAEQVCARVALWGRLLL